MVWRATGVTMTTTKFHSQSMVSSRDGAHGDTATHGSDFGTVKEVTAEETDRVERVEKEDKDGRNNRCGFVVPILPLGLVVWDRRSTFSS